MGEVTQPRPPEETSDLELEHSKLRHDIEVIRRYGEAHPDEWTELLVENEPSVRIVVLFACTNPRHHAEALGELVEYPDQLEVRWTEFSRAQLEQMLTEIQQLAMSSERGSFTSWGIGPGRINVSVAADQEKIASTLVERFGDAVVVRVGAFPYPNIFEARSGNKNGSGNEGTNVPLISTNELKVSIDDDLVVSSGGTSHGSLRFHNLGVDEVVLATNGGVTARVVDPSTGEVVGGFVGAQSLPLIHYSIPPGGTTIVPLLVGTASFKSKLGYAVPPGQWMIDALITIKDNGVHRIPPMSIVITEQSV
jgi:hypothetical protein